MKVEFCCQRMKNAIVNRDLYLHDIMGYEVCPFCGKTLNFLIQDKQ